MIDSQASNGGMKTAWIDLAQPLYEGMSCPTLHGVPSFAIDELPSKVAGVTISITKMSMGAHTGTHIDAARHFIADGSTIDEYPFDRFFGPGVVLDMQRNGAVELTAAEFELATPAIRDGDIVFVYFGSAEDYGTAEYEIHPYLTESAADFLVSKNVRIFGVDTMTPDMPAAQRREGFDFPVHRRLLANDVLIVENLGAGLAKLAGKRAILAAIPLRILGADGAPIAAIGWVDGAAAAEEGTASL